MTANNDVNNLVDGFMETSKIEADTMRIWREVCDSEPEQLTFIDQRGGFLSICAQTQIRKATELWGPFGTKWGLMNTHFLTSDHKLWDIYKKEFVDRTFMFLRAKFYYPGGQIDANASIMMTAEGEWEKKMETDITTKCLSKLGFNSDVFEGSFDDNKYVSQITAPLKYREALKTLSKEILSEDKDAKLVAKLEKIGWPFTQTVAMIKKLTLKVKKEG